MATFAAATAEKIGRYLGYPASNVSQTEISSALTAIETMTNTTYSDNSIAAIEGYISRLDALVTAINTQATTEGSTLLPELRREYRRFCALTAIATGLPIFADTVGATQA